LDISLSEYLGPKRDRVRGEWRKLHNDKLNDLYLTQYCLGDQIEKNEMGGACSPYGGEEMFGGET
jgi:hypothetical protein